MRELTEKVAAVYDILSDVYDKSPWTQEQILSDMQQDNVDYFFVEVDKTAIGFLAIQQLVGELEITNIAVKKPIKEKAGEVNYWRTWTMWIFPFS